MTFDLWLFNLINGVAGRYHWLDILGQWIAVFGLFAVVILVLGIIWAPHHEGLSRRRFIFAILLSGVICFALLAAEWLLTTFLLHHDLRSRPANAHWATLLITERSNLAFPAWPVVIAFAIGIPSCRMVRLAGFAAITIGLLIAISLVFVGVNYPFDVLTAMVSGSTIGLFSSIILHRRTIDKFGKRIVYAGIVAWLTIIIWGGIIFASERKQLLEETPIAAESTVSTGVKVMPPAEVVKVLSTSLTDGKTSLIAATNGHLLVGWLTIKLPDANVKLADVERMARISVNSLFTLWKPLDLITIEIDADFPGEKHSKVGTLYTATVNRSQWPTGGFSRNQRLPGNKFYHARFLKSEDIAPITPISTGSP